MIVASAVTEVMTLVPLAPMASRVLRVLRTVTRCGAPARSVMATSIMVSMAGYSMPIRPDAVDHAVASSVVSILDAVAVSIQRVSKLIVAGRRCNEGHDIELAVDELTASIEASVCAVRGPKAVG